MTQKALSESSGVSVPTLKRMEASDGLVSGYADNTGSVVASLSDVGIEFILANGGGEGVRLKAPTGVAESALEATVRETVDG